MEAGRAAYPRRVGAAPYGVDLAYIVGVGVAGRRVAVVVQPDGEAQRGAPLRARVVHAGAVVSQQPDDTGVVVLRGHEQGRGADLVRVVHVGVTRTVEDQPHDIHVTAAGRVHEWRCLVRRGLEAWPAQVEWRAARWQQPAYRRDVAANARVVKRVNAHARHCPLGARGAERFQRVGRRRAGGSVARV